MNGAVNTVRYYSVGGGIAVYNGGTVVMNEGSTVSYNSVNGTVGSEEGYVTGNIDNVGGGI